MIPPQRVDQLLKMKRFAEARDLAKQSLADIPFDVDMLELLARANYGLGDFEEALSAVEAALAALSGDGHILTLRGQILSRLGRHDDAMADFEAALALSPSLVYAHVALIEAVVRNPVSDKLGSKAKALLDKAKKSRDALLGLHPEMDISHLMSAQVDILEKKYTKARASTEIALKIDPNNPVAHQLHGLALQGIGDIRSAGDAYVAAGKIDPTSPTSGNLLEGLGAGAAVPFIGGGFLLFRVLTRGGRAAGSADVPVGAILLVIVLIVGLYFILRDPAEKPKRPEDQLSAEARAALRARRETES